MADDEHDGSTDAVADPVGAAADTLYAAPVDDFMAVRGELAKAAKAAGDTATAKAVAALRKPTVAAAVVNRYVHAEPDVVERLTDLGDRLRTAQQDLDATTLRELTTERRRTVADIVRAAFAHADRGEPATGLRDEVSATFDAAVADPDVAQRLGRLLRPERFSGFGVAAGPPGLTLVQGGRGAPARTRPARSTPGAEPEPKQAPAKKAAAKKAAAEKAVPTATARRLDRRREQARAEFDTADERFTTAEAAQRDGTERVRTLTAELAELQRDLDEAKRGVETARREVRTARARRRDARAALDRAERAVERGAD